MKTIRLIVLLAAAAVISACSGFQVGSVVYCAKDDACAVTITKPKSGEPK